MHACILGAHEVRRCIPVYFARICGFEDRMDDLARFSLSRSASLSNGMILFALPWTSTLPLECLGRCGEVGEECARSWTGVSVVS